MTTQEINTPFELFGYECGPGWLPLIQEAQSLIDKYNATVNDERGEVKFVQVKEKWGELCLYLNFYPAELMDPIRELEEKSHHVCEHCGVSNADVKLQNTHGWYMTLCPDCREKELTRYNNMFKH